LQGDYSKDFAVKVFFVYYYYYYFLWKKSYKGFIDKFEEKQIN